MIPQKKTPNPKPKPKPKPKPIPKPKPKKRRSRKFRFFLFFFFFLSSCVFHIVIKRIKPIFSHLNQNYQADDVFYLSCRVKMMDATVDPLPPPNEKVG